MKPTNSTDSLISDGVAQAHQIGGSADATIHNVAEQVGQHSAILNTAAAGTAAAGVSVIMSLGKSFNAAEQSGESQAGSASASTGFSGWSVGRTAVRESGANELVTARSEAVLGQVGRDANTMAAQVSDGAGRLAAGLNKGMIANRVNEAGMLASKASTSSAASAGAALEGVTRHVSTGIGAVGEAMSMLARRTFSAVAHTVNAAFTAATATVAPVLAPVGIAIGLVVVLVLGIGLATSGGGGSQPAHPGSAASAGTVGDDYPYPENYGQGMSPMGYAYGNCTDFVAWRINRDAGVTSAPWKFTWGLLTPLGGHGSRWGAPGNLPGWEVTTTPGPGDIFSVPAGTIVAGNGPGPYGHVAYVAQMNEDGSILTEHYGYNKYYQLTFTPEQVASYIEQGVVFKTNPDRAPLPMPGGSFTGREIHSPEQARQYAASRLSEYGWDESEMAALTNLWNGESGWRWNAENPTSGAYGIPQALPADKMASAGADWRNNPATQIEWGLRYIKDRYGSPTRAWEFWQSQNPHWY